MIDDDDAGLCFRCNHRKARAAGFCLSCSWDLIDGPNPPPNIDLEFHVVGDPWPDELGGAPSSPS